MKKLFVMLLALLTLITTASAQTLRLYRVDKPESFTAAHPEVELVSSYDSEESFWYNGMELNNELLSGSFRWDVFQTETKYTDLMKLYEKGYMLDLSSSEFIRDFVSRLHPDIADQCMYDGKIFAVPTYIGYEDLPITVWVEKWQDAGYTQDDLPQSYGEFLDFVEAWLDRREVDPDLTLNVYVAFEPSTYDVHSHSGRFVDELLDSYINQRIYAGETLRFDDPDLVTLLERARTIGERVFIYEPTKTEENSNYGLFTGAGDELQYARLKNWQVDLRIHDDQPTLVRFFMGMTGVYAGTANPELAIELVEDSLREWMDSFRAPEHLARLCVDGQPVRNPQFESQQRLSQNMIEMCERRLAGDDTPYTEYVDMTNLDYYQDMIAQLAVSLKEMDDTQVRDRLENAWWGMEQYKEYEYVLSPENLAAWQEFAQHLYFPGPDIFTTDEGYANFKSLKKQFVDGSIDAQQLVSDLDRIAWMMEMENQ